MAPNDEQAKLEALRTKILDNLSSMGDTLASSDDVSLEALMAIAHSTGNVTILEKALQKVQDIENGSDKADALLGLLDEVELRLSEQEIGEEEQPSDAVGATPVKEQQPELTERPAEN